MAASLIIDNKRKSASNHDYIQQVSYSKEYKNAGRFMIKTIVIKPNMAQ